MNVNCRRVTQQILFLQTVRFHDLVLFVYLLGNFHFGQTVKEYTYKIFIFCPVIHQR
jgi:hypothetical protein